MVDKIWDNLLSEFFTQAFAWGGGTMLGIALIATAAYLYLRKTRPAWASAIPISLAVIASVIAIQVGLKMQTFFEEQKSAVQRLEEAQKPIPDDKLEETLRKWADDMRWGVQRLDSKDSLFAFEVTLPPVNGLVKVAVSRPASVPGYIGAAIALNLTETQKNTFDKLSARDAQELLSNIKTELAKAKANFFGVQRPFKSVTIQYLMPITSSLTQHTFVSLVMDLAYARVLATEVIVKTLGDT